MRINNSIVSVMLGVVFLLVALGLSWHGKNRRVFLHDQIALTVDSGESAYRAWEEKGLRGRVLLLFGRYPHIKKSIYYQNGRQLTSSNFIELAAFNSIVRRIYYVVPDEGWSAAVQQGEFGAFRSVPGMERGRYLFNLIGIPIIVTTPSSLPGVSEPVLVFMDDQPFAEATVRNMLAEKGIVSDLFIAEKGK